MRVLIQDQVARALWRDPGPIPCAPTSAHVIAENEQLRCFGAAGKHLQGIKAPLSDGMEERRVVIARNPVQGII